MNIRLRGLRIARLTETNRQQTGARREDVVHEELLVGGDGHRPRALSSTTYGTLT